MNPTYGVIWRGAGDRLARGRLELGRGSLRLVGRDATAGDVVEEVGYADLANVHVGRLPAERIDGRRTVVIERVDGGSISIAGVVDAGAIAELADRLAELQRLNVRRRAAIVLPLCADSLEAVRALVADGPPFDPDALGIEEHDVYLTEDEVVFVFTWHGESTIDVLLDNPAFWARAAAWGEFLAGPPRITEAAYHWSRPTSSDVALLPPGLHGRPQ